MISKLIKHTLQTFTSNQHQQLLCYYPLMLLLYVRIFSKGIQARDEGPLGEEEECTLYTRGPDSTRRKVET